MQQEKILIVEDEGIVALDLKRHLVQKGYIVTGTANKGARAIEMVVAEPPNLILMDIHIKGESNGIETARQIQRSHNIPIIFLTAHSDSATLEEAKSVTPYGFLVKPFEERSLHSTIEMALHRHRTEQKLKAVEAEREILREQLLQAEKLKSIGTMAGGIAHNFNNLLMGIQGRATVLAMGLDDTAPELEHLAAIQDTVQQASHLTDQLLGLALKGKYELTAVDVQKLVNDCVITIGRQHQELEVWLETEPGKLMIEGDERQIKQVIANLLENGHQAMPNGGKLHVLLSTVNVTEDTAKDSALKVGKYIKLTVRDSGEGMDEVTRWRIFDPFFTTKNMTKSTGLGLSAAYGIITNHDGHIHVVSTVGEGTTFEVFLPVPRKLKTTKKTDREKTKKSGIRTILLIDDEELILEVGRAMLENQEYQVITAQNGQQGIDALIEKKTQ